MNMNEYNSRWNYMADRAGVSRTPTNEPTKFQIVGRFIGEWKTEVDYLLQKYNGGFPFNFTTKLKKEKPYTYDLDIADMRSVGLSEYTNFAYKISPKNLQESFHEIPVIKQMIDWFGFTGLVLPKLHIQKPGQVFPYHFDDLTTHRNNTDRDIDPRKYARVEVMLFDWDYGHVWGVGNTYWSNWKSGEIMYHPWFDIPHGTANCGMTPRINLQITGELTEELITKLNRNNGNIVLGE